MLVMTGILGGGYVDQSYRRYRQNQFELRSYSSWDCTKSVLA